MYDPILYEKAVAHFSDDYDCDISNSYTKEHAEELIYCYVQGKSLIDFDFWTKYETLLGEKINYDEYLYLDSKYDGDPQEIEKEDLEYESVVAILKRHLADCRKEQEVVGSVNMYYLSTITEDGDALREFIETDISLDKNVPLCGLKYACVTNPHFLENGVFSEGKFSIESNYVDGVGFTNLAVTEREVPFTKADLRKFLRRIDANILREVLPEAIKEETLNLYIEREISYRFWKITGACLSEAEKEGIMNSFQFCPEKVFDEKVFDQQLLAAYDAYMSDKIWITVYKDTLGFYRDMDNLTEILVPTEWLKEALKKEGVTDFDNWCCEYTADNTEEITYQARRDGVIIDCKDSYIPILQNNQRANKKTSLEEQLKVTREDQKNAPKNESRKEPDLNR